MSSDKEILVSLLNKLEERKNNGDTERELGFLLEGFRFALEDNMDLSEKGLKIVERIYKELKENREGKENIIKKYKDIIRKGIGECAKIKNI